MDTCVPESDHVAVYRARNTQLSAEQEKVTPKLGGKAWAEDGERVERGQGRGGMQTTGGSIDLVEAAKARRVVSTSPTRGEIPSPSNLGFGGTFHLIME